MPGLFITFEGPDGAGKTTQLKLTAQNLTAMGYKVLCTREPGGTPISDKIRELLLDPTNKEMDTRTEALLYAAARAQHVAEVIEPALAEGTIVLCDRFVDSSLAYQGWGRGLPLETLIAVSGFATRGLQPDITFFLDVCLEVGNTRVANRGGSGQDRIEQEQDAFRARVYDGFHQLSILHASRIICIDAAHIVEDVQRNIWTHLQKRLADM